MPERYRPVAGASMRSGRSGEATGPACAARAACARRWGAGTLQGMATTETKFGNMVGGEVLDAVGGGTREVVNPASGAVIGTVPEGTQADVDRAVGAAVTAFETWRDATPAQRSATLL